MSFESVQSVTATGDVTGSLPGVLTFNPGANFERATTYKTLFSAGTVRLDALSAQTVYLAALTGAPSAAQQGTAHFYIDPADFAVGTLTSYCRCALSLLVNATTPVANFTLGLYPITAVAGGAAAVTPTFGAAVAGSTAVITAPVAGSINYAAGADFAFPAAGAFALGVVISAGMAASSSVAVRGSLQRRSA